MRKTQTLSDTQETFRLIKKRDARMAMARAMLKYGNMTDEAWEYVLGQYAEWSYKK